MKKKYADKWVKALRSGKYSQTRLRLKNSSNSYCCLGVLCEVVKDEVGGVWKSSGSKCKEFVIEGGPTKSDSVDDTHLPASVQKLVGLKSPEGAGVIAVKNKEEFDCLIAMNDKGRMTFKEIALVIEKNWRKL